MQEWQSSGIACVSAVHRGANIRPSSLDDESSAQEDECESVFVLKPACSRLQARASFNMESCITFFQQSHVTPHTSHLTPHTSHITPHTSHVTRHTSHVTHYTSHVTRHTLYVTRHASHVTRHTIWQLVHAGITKLAHSDWSRRTESDFRRYSHQESVDVASTRRAMGTRKQARDIMAGGWGGGRRQQNESVEQQQLQQTYGSAPQLLQGEPAAYTQRANSRSGHMHRTPPSPPRLDTSRNFQIQRMSIADDDDCDDRYDESMGVSHGSMYLHDSSSSPHYCARPSSPDFEQAEGWVGRPSTPDHVTPTYPPMQSYVHMRPATAEISSWKHSLVHLDLSGNRCVTCAVPVQCALQQF
jgi:hypothetical protein